MQLKRRVAGLIRHSWLWKHIPLDSTHLFSLTVDQGHGLITYFSFFNMKKSANRSCSALNMHQNTAKHSMNNGTSYQTVTNRQKLRTEAKYPIECDSPSKVRKLSRPEGNAEAFPPKPPNNIMSNMNPVLDKLAAHLTANLTPLSDQSQSPQDSYDRMHYSPIRKTPDAVVLPTPLGNKPEVSRDRHQQHHRLSTAHSSQQPNSLCVCLNDKPHGDYVPGLDLPLLLTPGDEFAPRIDLISRFSDTPSPNSSSSGLSAVVAAAGSRCVCASSPPSSSAAAVVAASSSSCLALRAAAVGDVGLPVGDSNRSVQGEEEAGVTVDGLSSRVLPTTTTTATRMDSTAAQRPASAHTSSVTVPSIGVELSKTAKARYAHLRQQHMHLVERQPLPTLHLHLSKDGSSPLPPGWHRAPNHKSRPDSSSGDSHPPQAGPEEQDVEAADMSSADRLYPYYYYHVRTRQTRWDPPVYPWDADPNDDGLGNALAMFADDDPEAPYNWGCASKYAITHDEIESMYARIRHRMLERQCTELLHELAGNADAPKGAMEQGFAIELFTLVHNTLRTYRDARCKLGRILNDEDLYYLTKKLSQAVILKEVQKLHQAQSNSLFAVNPEVSPAVQSRVSIYVRKYVESKGAFYRRRMQQPMMAVGPYQPQPGQPIGGYHPYHHSRPVAPGLGTVQNQVYQQHQPQLNYHHYQQQQQQHQYPYHQPAPVPGRSNHGLPAPQPVQYNTRPVNTRQQPGVGGGSSKYDQVINNTYYR